MAELCFVDVVVAGIELVVVVVARIDIGVVVVARIDIGVVVVARIDVGVVVARIDVVVDVGFYEQGDVVVWRD